MFKFFNRLFDNKPKPFSKIEATYEWEGNKREFAEFVAAIREAEVIVGVEEKKVNESEHHKYFRKVG